MGSRGRGLATALGPGVGSRARGGPPAPGQEVLCRVQQALEDLIMVSFTAPGNRVFQGVLLDTSKRNIPYGISPPGGFAAKLAADFPPAPPPPVVAAEDLTTVARRQTYYQDGPPRPPLSLPSSGRARTLLGQDRLGVRLRARQVLCSKCSSVCNEKGVNVKESSRKERERPPQGPETKTGVSSSTAERRLGRPPGKPRPALSSRPRKDPAVPLKPSVANCPVPILDLDKLQYARTKARATSNCLVPKVRRLRIPGMVLEDVGPAPGTSQDTSDPTITSSRVSSSTPALPPDSMQPLKIRFAHKQSSRSCNGRQYSIVKESDSDSGDQQKENIDGSESEDSEAEKRKSDESLEVEDGENQPLKKVFKKEQAVDACRTTQAAPVLKISFGKDPAVSTLATPDPPSTSPKEPEALKPPSQPSPRPLHSASSKAARKALKRAKKEAGRRARLGLASPGRTYLGSRSPGNMANVSPTSSPLHLASPRPLSTPSPAYSLLCPSSQKIIIKRKKHKKHKRVRQVSDPAGPPAPEEEGPLGQADCPAEETADCLPSLPVESALLPDGHTLCVGDVVWGRTEVNGWWPGKVVNLLLREEGRAMAQVTWYTCTSTSIIPCKDLRPFLESYEAQFNKRKSGSYPEAVNLAAEDARQASSLPLSGSPRSSPLASPLPPPQPCAPV